MNDKPKSVWTRPWQGWRKVFVWFALLAITIFVILFGLGLASMPNHNPAEHILPALGLALGISLLIMVIEWFVRWLGCWRNFKKLIWGLACLVTLVALFYAVENFRGQRAWDKYRQAAELRGEKFEVVRTAPPPVPDDQNFAMQPIWVEQISTILGLEKAKTWYGDRVAALGHTNLVARLEMPSELDQKLLKHTNQPGNWQIARPTDLIAWQNYYRQLSAITNYFPVPAEPQNPAADVLLALSKHDSVLQELRTASQLPHARFPVGYADANPAMILLPHLAPLRGITQMLRQRAVAEVRANQTDQALDNIRLMLRLNETIRMEPFLISHLVNIAILQIELQPIWEGLAERRWNEPQLIELDALLTKLDFLADYELAIGCEQAFGANIIDYLQRNRKEIADIGWNFDEVTGQPRTDNSLKTVAFRAIPRGWFEQNKISVCRMYSKYFSKIIDQDKRVYSSAIVKQTDPATAKITASQHPYNWFTKLLLPALQTAAKKFVYAQAVTDQARLAIALERYRIAQGQFPESLETLAPKFIPQLPHDIINGQPLKYQRTTNGSFVLYSVGWNETDDGGTIGLNKGGNFDPNTGDWVWRYPAE